MYITTESGNVISKQSRISGSKYIMLAGKSFINEGVIIRGDASTDGQPVIGIGRYCYLDRNCRLDPPVKDAKAYPLKIGSHVSIGKNTKVNAASISDCVVIQDNCDIGRFAVIKECAVIKEGTKIPPFAVVAPYTLVTASGQEELPESAQQVIERYCRQRQAGLDCGFPFQ